MDTSKATVRNETERRAFSVHELAKAYSVSPGLVRLEIARGRLKGTRIGRRLVVPVEAVSEWLSGSPSAPLRPKRHES